MTVGPGTAITANVVDAAAAAGVGVLIVTGNAFEYRATGRPLHESDRAPPQFDQGRVARAGTDYAGRVGRAAGVATVTVRLFSIFGPDDHRRRLVPRLLAGARTGQTVALSDPSIVRDWVYVGDAVDAYVRAAQWALGAAIPSAPPVFNVGSGRATTIGQLVDLVGSLAGAPLRVAWGRYPADEHDGGWWVADPTASRQVLGWGAACSLENGLTAMLAAGRPPS